MGGTYGDDDARYGNWATDLVVGYTFRDVPWTPRLYVEGVYFQGEDNRDITRAEWQAPFFEPEASISFNRLFSDRNYMPTINDNGWLSNFYQVSAGIDLKPTEKVSLHAHVAREWVDEPFDFPVPGQPPYVTEEGSDDLGWEIAAWVKYNYSKDLWFLVYGNWLFADDGLTEGSFIQFNSTDFCGGSGDDNAGYLFWMSVLRF